MTNTEPVSAQLPYITQPATRESGLLERIEAQVARTYDRKTAGISIIALP